MFCSGTLREQLALLCLGGYSDLPFLSILLVLSSKGVVLAAVRMQWLALHDYEGEFGSAHLHCVIGGVLTSGKSWS